MSLSIRHVIPEWELESHIDKDCPCRPVVYAANGYGKIVSHNVFNLGSRDGVVPTGVKLSRERVLEFVCKLEHKP